MKKILSILCLLALMLTMFASCEEEMHEHIFSKDEWASDSDYHWHPCVAVDGCSEKGEKAAHEFELGVDKDGNVVNICTVCGADNDKVPSAPEHEHTFANEYESSENFHWFPCTVEGCYEMKDKNEHVFGNPEVTYSDKKIIIKSICVDCKYEKIEEQEVKTEVDDAVSWNDAFKNFKLTNFTMNVDVIRETHQQHNHCVVTENSAYYCIPSSREFYTVKNSDGTCTTYYRDGSERVFEKLENMSDKYLVGAQTETVLQISFEDNFDKFVYDKATASYVYDGEIMCKYYSFSGNQVGDIVCYDNVVKITDGKISYIEAKYYFPNMSTEDTTLASFVYYNIGLSEVEIPQAVIEGKEMEPAQNVEVPR